MSRTGSVVLSLLAVSVVGGAVSAPASAACSGGSRSVFCFANSQEAHSEKALGSGTAVLASTIIGIELRIECKDNTFQGVLELLGASKDTFELLGCTVAKPEKCGINEPIIWRFTGHLSVGQMPATDLLTGAEANEEFTKITVTGASCSLKNEYRVTGLQLVELPKGEESLVTHEIVAKKSGSHLKINTEIASLSGTDKVHLLSGLAWLVVLGL